MLITSWWIIRNLRTYLVICDLLCCERIENCCLEEITTQLHKARIASLEFHQERTEASLNYGDGAHLQMGHLHKYHHILVCPLYYIRCWCQRHRALLKSLIVWYLNVYVGRYNHCGSIRQYINPLLNHIRSWQSFLIFFDASTGLNLNLHAGYVDITINLMLL